MREDPIVLIGRDFWDDLGGVGTYETMLDLFEAAGEELAPEINAFFSA